MRRESVRSVKVQVLEGVECSFLESVVISGREFSYRRTRGLVPVQDVLLLLKMELGYVFGPVNSRSKACELCDVLS